MYVYPDMELKILRNIPIQNDYDHTIYFATATAQQNFFLSPSFVKFTLTNQMYQRRERGWIQVNINQNELWDCTYLAYKNSHYYNRWFYAFILNVEYVNDNVSKINFEIDVLQTWNGMYTLEKCFVEREHSTTDELFENTVPENLYVGDQYYKANNLATMFDYSCSRAALLTTRDDTNSGADYFPRIYNGATNLDKYVSGLQYYVYDLLDSTSSQALIDQLQSFVSHGYEDNVIALILYPRAFGDANNLEYYYQSYHVTPNLTTIDGYTPKNKKLFSFPYTYLKLSNGRGLGKEFLFENWASGSVGYFTITGTALGVPSITFVPHNYAGKSGDNYDEAMSDRINIVCPWIGDSYQVWLAQNGIKEGSSAFWGTMSGLASMLVGMDTGNVYLAAHGAISIGASMSHAIGVTNAANHIPNQAHGMEENSNVLANLNGSNGMFVTQMSMKAEYAQIVDEYLSKLGYACHRIKVPNTHARQNWTYVKTVGCEAIGPVPVDDINKIKSIFDKGITFWADGYNVGNYGDFSNPVLT